MPSERENQAAGRLRELSQDPVAARYLVGYLVAATPARWWPDLVEEALKYRELAEEPAAALWMTMLVAERWSRE